MGATDVYLYSDDYACDVRGEYRHQLRLGKTNDEAVKELLASLWSDGDDEPTFWYALADTQWNYGRLTPDVREKALTFIDRETADGRWKTPELMQKRLVELQKLKKKLMAEQPPKKRVMPYRFYRCPWALGDVFAYQLHDSESEEKGLKGQYIVFRKITEDFEWPGNIIPSVHIYRWIGPEIPSLETVRTLPLLPMKFIPEVYRSKNIPVPPKHYLLSLGDNTKRSFPKEYLTYLGNIQDDQTFPYVRDGSLSGYDGTIWRFFEYRVLNMYFIWKDEP